MQYQYANVFGNKNSMNAYIGKPVLINILICYIRWATCMHKLRKIDMKNLYYQCASMIYNRSSTNTHITKKINTKATN